MRKQILTLSLALAIIVWGRCDVLADGPYHGRIIDKETKKPIEGAAVLAVWWKRTAMIGHPMESVHDAQEVVTDSDGNFTIPGTSTFSLNPFSRIDWPKFTIFKPGYKAYYGVLASSVEGTPTGLYEKEGKMIAELQELKTREERLRNLDQVYVPTCLGRDRDSRLCLPKEKFPNTIRLKEAEYENLGLTGKRIR